MLVGSFDIFSLMMCDTCNDRLESATKKQGFVATNLSVDFDDQVADFRIRHQHLRHDVVLAEQVVDILRSKNSLAQHGFKQ